MSEQEKKNDRVGLTVSLIVHAALLLLFIFLLAWREPIPPIPEYGIELNFGLDQVGSGTVQPVVPASVNPEPEEEPAPQQPAVQEEIAPEPVPESTPTETERPEVQEVREESPQPKEPAVTQPTPSPTTVEKQPEKKVEETPKKETPKLNPAATYPGKSEQTDGADGTAGTGRQPANSNHGDDPGTEGDKGDPEGTLDSRALYGTPGGGGGAALEMSGWNWDFLPKPKDTSNESGRIVFEIKIDEDGEIISIRTIEKTVSDALVKVYRAEVGKLTFSPTSDNARPAPTSTGRITFIIRAR